MKTTALGRCGCAFQVMEDVPLRRRQIDIGYRVDIAVQPQRAADIGLARLLVRVGVRLQPAGREVEVLTTLPCLDPLPRRLRIPALRVSTRRQE